MVADQGAISARRDEVAALPRPSVSEGALDLKEAVESVRELDDLWNVYAREWVWVWTSTKVGEEGREQCLSHFADTYEGRVVYPDEVKVIPSSEAHPDQWPWRLALLLPTLKSVHKLRSQAEAHAVEEGFEDPKIVSRNSKEDFAIRNYGKKKLLR